MPLSFVEAPFFRRLFLRQNPYFNFPSKQVLREGLLLRVAKKTKENFVSPSFASCSTCTMSFDLWMSIGGIDTFVLIVRFLNNKWEPCHVIMGFFKTMDTIRNVLALQMNDLFAKHKLNVYVFAYVKNEGNNLSTMTFVLTSIVFC